MDVYIVCGLAVLILVLLLIKTFRKKATLNNLPPGPPRKFLVGNMFDINPDKPFLSFTDISREHGDIFSLQVGGSVIVVVNTIEAFRELYEENKYGEKLDGRAHTFVSEIIGEDVSVALGPITAAGKQRREVYYAAIRNLTHYHGRKLQDEISHLVEFIGTKGDQPQDLKTPIELYLTNVVMMVLTGERYEYDDPRLIMSNERTAIIRNFLRPRSQSIMTKFPWLRHLPFGPGKEYGRCNFLTKKLKEIIFDPAKVTFDPNDYRGAIDRLLRLQKDTLGNLASEFTDDKVNISALSFFGAGTAGPIGVHLYFIVVILNKPEIAEKLRSEMDKVLARSRLPTLADRKSLMFAEAVVLELFRWGSPAPLLVPRRADADFELRGYTIPKDATIITNAWKIHHDPTIWKNPWEFRPERFLGPNGFIMGDLKKNVIAFGAGRRKCFGTELVFDLMFLFVTSLVRKFDFEAPNGELPDMDLNLSTTLSATIHPELFKVIVKPRSH